MGISPEPGRSWGCPRWKWRSLGSLTAQTRLEFCKGVEIGMAGNGGSHLWSPFWSSFPADGIRRRIYFINLKIRIFLLCLVLLENARQREAWYGKLQEFGNCRNSQIIPGWGMSLLTPQLPKAGTDFSCFALWSSGIPCMECNEIPALCPVTMGKGIPKIPFKSSSPGTYQDIKKKPKRMLEKQEDF